jgi:hypothetical protein
LKPKEIVDCFGFSLPKPNPKINSKKLSENILASFAKLESSALSGNFEAIPELLLRR